jgi:hypothetical protein
MSKRIINKKHSHKRTKENWTKLTELTKMKKIATLQKRFLFEIPRVRQVYLQTFSGLVMHN